MKRKHGRDLLEIDTAAAMAGLDPDAAAPATADEWEDVRSEVNMVIDKLTSGAMSRHDAVEAIVTAFKADEDEDEEADVAESLSELRTRARRICVGVGLKEPTRDQVNAVLAASDYGQAHQLRVARNLFESERKKAREKNRKQAAGPKSVSASDAMATLMNGGLFTPG